MPDKLHPARKRILRLREQRETPPETQLLANEEPKGEREARMTDPIREDQSQFGIVHLHLPGWSHGPTRVLAARLEEAALIGMDVEGVEAPDLRHAGDPRMDRVAQSAEAGVGDLIETERAWVGAVVHDCGCQTEVDDVHLGCEVLAERIPADAVEEPRRYEELDVADRVTGFGAQFGKKFEGSGAAFRTLMRSFKGRGVEVKRVLAVQIFDRFGADGFVKA